MGAKQWSTTTGNQQHPRADGRDKNVHAAENATGHRATDINTAISNTFDNGGYQQQQRHQGNRYQQ